MNSPAYDRYYTRQFLNDIYGDTPAYYNRRRASKRTPKTPRQTFPKILSDHIDNISKQLDFGHKHNDHINWVPPILPSLQTPTTDSHGSNNTHYVIPKVKAVFAGRTLITKEETPWNELEKIAQQNWDLKQISQSATRNIDFWREFQEGPIFCRQACEIKKTTGCFQQPPVFIRSSKKQLEALLDQSNPAPAQIHPSLYIVGSVDYDKTQKQWLITWWFIPVKIQSDFICINTSNFKWTPDVTPNNDGWVSKPPQP